MVNFGLYSQEKREVKFEDGTVLDYTFYYDKPRDLHDWSVALSLESAIAGSPIPGFALDFYYEITKKLVAEAKLLLPVSNSSFLKPSFQEAYKNGTEIFGEINYEVSTNSKQIKRSVVLKSAYSYSKNEQVNYTANIPVIKRKSIFASGGINYTLIPSYSSYYLDEDSTSYYIIGQSALMLSLGASYYQSYHLRIGIPAIRDVLRSTKISFKLLLGVPTDINIISENKFNDVNYKPAIEFDKPKFLPVGFRVGFDYIHGFSRKPKGFYKIGFGVGLNPSYSLSTYTADIDFINQAVYGSIRLGLGFGKVVKN